MKLPAVIAATAALALPSSAAAQDAWMHAEADWGFGMIRFRDAGPQKWAWRAEWWYEQFTVYRERTVRLRRKVAALRAELRRMEAEVAALTLETAEHKSGPSDFVMSQGSGTSWDAVAECESGNDWSANTGNG